MRALSIEKIQRGGVLLLLRAKFSLVYLILFCSILRILTSSSKITDG
jgi:hypothetical protein